jgi:hypothetical protein
MSDQADRGSTGDDGAEASGAANTPQTRQPSDGDGTDGRWRDRLEGALARRLGIDVRALAAFRVAVAAILLGDLAFRARELRAFYTDAGVLPRSALAAESPALATLSVHALSGAPAVQAALFGATALAAFAVLVGYRTRVATVLTLGLVASMHARNPYVLNGGDGLLSLSFLLGVFLPLSARWSVDACRRRGESDASPTAATPPDDGDGGVGDRRDTLAVSLATAALLAQPVTIYAANAGFKLRSGPWVEGDAILTVLQLGQYSVRLGPYLTAAPRLLTALTWLWVALLLAAPLLLVATGWRRTALAAAYATVHLGMAATMRLGFFPLVSVAVLLPFLPPPIWDALERRVATPATRAATVADRAVGGTARWQPPPWSRRAARRLGTVAVAVVLVGSILWPTVALGIAAVPDNGSEAAPDYTWRLFAPHPSTHHRWIVAPATLSTGDRVDALDGSPVTWERPPDVAGTYPSTLWHRYVADLRAGNVADPSPLGAYLCRRGVPGRSAAIDTVAFYVVEEPVPAADRGERRRVQYVERDCRE